jgi:protocatechuate 3,4-dioxygenase beta subunit
MKPLLIFGIITILATPGCSQTSNQNKKSSGNNSVHVGGGCDGCQAIYESSAPFEKLKSVDTLPDFNEKGPKIEISGIVYQRDGKTPAKDIVIYVYHTDQTGHYTPKGNSTGAGRRHGYIRGWMKTDKNGFYSFYTLKPAPYPNAKVPAHIHVIVKEPDKNEYYLDEYLFEGDPNLKGNESGDKPRGGNGILKLVQDKDGKMHGTRHIFLGLNIPDYPYSGLQKLNSGLALGANCPAFEPVHLSGADSGKKVCPMCRYGYGQGVMIWFNHANVDQMKNFAKNFETEMIHRGEKKLRVFLVYMNPFYNQNDAKGLEILGRKLRTWCDEQNLKHVAMLWVPSPIDAATCGKYKINPEAKNTVFIYKKRTVVDKWVNIEYDNETFEMILKKLDEL